MLYKYGGGDYGALVHRRTGDSHRWDWERHSDCVEKSGSQSSSIHPVTFHVNNIAATSKIECRRLAFMHG